MRFRGYLCLFLASALANASLSRAAHCDESLVPQSDWIVEAATPERAEAISKLDAFIDRIQSENKKLQTDALLIVQGGKIVYERYFRGYSAQTKHNSWSMVKSVIGLMLGYAIERGALTLDTPVRRFFPSVLRDPRGAKLKVRHLLKMESGLDFEEEYFGLPIRADVVKMLYTVGPTSGFAEYVATRPFRADPGSEFSYSSGDTNLLSAVIAYAMPKSYDTLPWKAIFDPIGMKDVTFERDVHGAFIGSSYLYATPRDFARLGLLLARKGKWGNKQVVSKAWIQEMLTVSPSLNTPRDPSLNRPYGGQITINQDTPARGLEAPYTQLPKGATLMIGHQGQFIASIPELDAVIVRLSEDTKNVFPRDEYFGQAMNVVLASQGGWHSAKTPSVPVKSTLDRKSICGDDDGELVCPGEAEYEDRTLLGKILEVAQGLAAKEYCSCVFVMKRDPSACESVMKKGFPIVGLNLDRANRTVTVGWFNKRTARFTSEAFGCVLEP